MILFALDTFPTPDTLGININTAATEFTVAMANSGSSLRVRGFGLLDGAILSWDFPEVFPSGAGSTPVPIRVTRIQPDGTNTSYDTGVTSRPYAVFGGYQRGSSVYTAMNTREVGTNTVVKRIAKLDAATLLETDVLNVADATSISMFERGPAGYGLITLGTAGRVLHRLNESSMTLDASVDVDAYLNGVGYDGPGNGAAAMVVHDGVAYLDMHTFDFASGDERRVLVSVDVATMSVLGRQEFDAPTFGQQLGSASLAFAGGVVVHAAWRGHLARWEVRRFNASTLAETTAMVSQGTPSGEFVAPWGTGVEFEGLVYFGTDSDSAVAVSPVAVFDPSAGTVSFTSLGTVTEDGGFYATLSPVAVLPAPP